MDSERRHTPAVSNKIKPGGVEYEEVVVGFLEVLEPDSSVA
jgi:hypothetical protein